MGLAAAPVKVGPTLARSPFQVDSVRWGPFLVGPGAGVDRRAGSGGAMGTGGNGFGGATGAAGATGAGGLTGSGGATGLGGTTGSGGMTGVGGTTGMGGTTGAGGTAGLGGMTGGGGMTGIGGAAGGASVDPDLLVGYKFDETTGTAAADSSGHNQTATLTSLLPGSAAFSTTHQVGTGALSLTSTSATVGGFVTIPASLQAMGATTAITISCWVNVSTARPWQRIFNFGSNTTTYMFLTTDQVALAPNSPRLGITTGGNLVEQTIDMTTRAPLSTGVWHHLAIVLGAGATYTGTLYVDKVAVGSNAAMTLRPSDLGDSTSNWIGRSQFTTGDPLFDGMIDDFRIYKRALTGAEIAALP